MTPSSRAALLVVAAGLGGCEKCASPTGTADGADAASERDGGVVNATVLPTASVAAMVNPENLPAYTGPTGSLEGTITVSGDPPLVIKRDFSRCAAAETLYGRSFREGDGRKLADAIVVVTGYQGFYLPEKEEAKQVRIEGCGYDTRTVTLTFGQRLDVKNMSADFWTPLLEPGQHNRFMIATPKGDAIRLYPKKPGHYLLIDRDRKYVDVDVYALLQPLHAVTDMAGHYRIDGVPVGKMTVRTTHPRFEGTATAELDVKPGVIQRLDLALVHTKSDAGAPGEDDAGHRPTLR
jgi:hypothetical protein